MGLYFEFLSTDFILFPCFSSSFLFFSLYLFVFICLFGFFGWFWSFGGFLGGVFFVGLFVCLHLKEETVKMHHILFLLKKILIKFNSFQTLEPSIQYV